jgi:predicted alpha/beta-hydrolase family hydrolase
VTSGFQTFSDVACDPPVRGFLHAPDHPNGNGLVLTHGAGSNCQAPLLVAMAEAFAGRGFTVLRCDLPFRQRRPHGPPGPGDAAEDRAGLKNAVADLQRSVAGRIFLSGHSYGGRQATMLCAAEPGVVDGLLLFSYPLHPPRKPEQLRTQHFPQLQTPALFVHGTRDTFGSIEEMETALRLIPSKHKLLPVQGVGHDLGFKGKTAREELVSTVIEAFAHMFG